MVSALFLHEPSGFNVSLNWCLILCENIGDWNLVAL